MSNRKFSLKQELQICDEYEDGLSSKFLGDKWGCDSSTVRNIVKRNNRILCGRGKSKTGHKHSEETKKKMSKAHKKFNDIQKLQICKEYDNGASSVELSKGYRCSVPTICNILKENNVRIRKANDYPKSVSEEGRKKIREAQKGRKRSKETRKKMGESKKGINNPMKRPEVSKKVSAALRGPNSPNWRGGKSFEPYCELFNDEFKERVREFWGYKCGISGKHQNEEKRKLAVHHINYNKQTCCTKDTPLFIPLSHSWHSKTNYNRKYWEEILTNYIMIYFDGECYLPKGG